MIIVVYHIYTIECSGPRYSIYVEERVIWEEHDTKPILYDVYTYGDIPDQDVLEDDIKKRVYDRLVKGEKHSVYSGQRGILYMEG